MNPDAHLARIQLNPHSRDVQRDLRDAAQMHKTLMRMLPDNLGPTPRHDTGLLYRLDETEQTSTLLVQAAVPLNTQHLPDNYGHSDHKSLAPLFRALRPGRTVRYRITLNPAKRERLPHDQKTKNGRIVPLTGPEADQWWTRRAAQAGLTLHTLLPTPQRPAQRTPTVKGAPTMRHHLMRYDGTATITDPTALTTALLTGIGRGKSYGAGLLSLAPANTP
ncbi:type I-E CRISPR-associated protein Cas6/Cse3/CasE [Streptomyces sp. NPDC004111]|uniref:type I-E CRISPR-associated protein Cas6/Cse3/CasE n=1 Tax=Streptomyces sp. NPDC004111 TaxID=3364690 RepID=UPI0036C74FB2